MAGLEALIVISKLNGDGHRLRYCLSKSSVKKINSAIFIKTS